MIHQCQGLSFRFEPGDDLPRIHAQLDDLESDAADNWLGLLSHVNHAHPTFTDLLQQLVTANHCPRCLLGRQVEFDRGSGGSRRFEKFVCLVMCGEQLLKLPAKFRLAGAGLVEVGCACLGRAAFERVFEQRLVGQIGGIHESNDVFTLTNEIRGQNGSAKRHIVFCRKKAQRAQKEPAVALSLFSFSPLRVDRQAALSRFVYHFALVRFLCLFTATSSVGHWRWDLISWNSHALARAQRRLAVGSEMPRAAAASSMVIPMK